MLKYDVQIDLPYDFIIDHGGQHFEEVETLSRKHTCLDIAVEHHMKVNNLTAESYRFEGGKDGEDITDLYYVYEFTSTKLCLVIITIVDDQGEDVKYIFNPEA